MEKLPVIRNMAASGLVSNKPAMIYGILINSAATGASTAIIYDGENATGKQILTIGTITSHSAQFSPLKGVYCEKGIYVSLGANVTSLTLVYENI